MKNNNSFLERRKRYLRILCFIINMRMEECISSLPLDISLVIKNNLKKVSLISYMIVNTDAFVNRINNLKKTYNFTFSFVKIIDTSSIDLYRFNIHNENISNKKISDGEFLLMVNKKLNLITTFTDRSKMFLKKSASRFLYLNFYPYINKITLTSQELFHILDSLEKNYGLQIYSTKSSGKRLFGEPETLVNFKKGNRVTFRKIFTDAYREELWVHWLTIMTEKKNNYLFKGDISRDGSISFIRYDGSILNLFMDELFKIGLNKIKRLENKEMTQKQAHPFILTYKQNIFDKIENVNRLKKLLAKVADFNSFVIHGGNPHLYMYIQDNKTRASYSIRTAGSNRIILTPQYLSDTASFSSLLNCLIDGFSEYESIEEVNYNG